MMNGQQSPGFQAPGVKKEFPLVSVIIPVYNVAPYLREALDSVVRQTYRNLDVIIVDDGSTDGSEAICEEYLSDPRVRVIHQGNRGLSNARNRGLDLAGGEYIAFLDPDDAYDPEFAERMLEAMENADVAICRYEVHRGTLDKGGRTEPLIKEGCYGRKEALRKFVTGSINFSVWNKFYRKEFWNRIRFPDGHNYEDVDTIYQVLDTCSQVRVLNETLYYHRRRPGSITDTFTKMNLEDRKLAFDHLAAFVEEHMPEIFGEEHLRKVRQMNLRSMMADYARGRVDTSEIRAACAEIRPAGLSFRFRTAVWMIRCCPWLLRMIYPVYRPFRLLAWKVFGR